MSTKDITQANPKTLLFIVLVQLTSILCSTFVKKVQRAIAKLNGWYHWQNDDRAAVTIAKNAQALFSQYLAGNLAVLQNLWNYITAQQPAFASQEAAIMSIRETCMLKIYNTTGTVLHFDLNQWIPRENIEIKAGSTDTIANMITHGSALVPIGTAVAGNGTMNPTTVGYTLFDNPFWCQMWKAVKRFKFNLAPGELKEFTFKRSYRWDQTEAPPADVFALRGASMNLTGYVFGQVAFDSAAGAAPTNIGTCAGGCITMNINKYKVNLMQNSNRQVVNKTTTFNIATAGTVYNPIGPNTGVATAF